MNNKALFTFLSILFFSVSILKAQDTTSVQSENEIQTRIENIGGASEEETDFTNLLDQLNYFKEHPINLNNTTIDELSQLGLLDQFRMNALLAHIQKNGKLLSVYELQSVDGFDLTTIFRVLPYVRVTTIDGVRKITFKDVMENGRNMVLMRYSRGLQESVGFSPPDSTYPTKPNSRYLGSPDKLYARYKFSYNNNISAGFTVEKDAGEVFLESRKKPQNLTDSVRDSLMTSHRLYSKSFDYFSAHLYYKNRGFVRTVALGDYEIQYGQGLTLWSGLAFGKSADAMNIRKNASGIKAYSSVNESSFMRGGAIALGIKRLQLDVFYSSKKVDANVLATDTLTDKVLEISSFQTTGYHRTPSELDEKHSINLRVMGSHLGYKSRSFNIGLTGVQTNLSVPLNPSHAPYSIFKYNGNDNLNVGIDYSLNVYNLNFFGEASRSQNEGMSYLNGVLASIDKALSVSVLQRTFSKKFQNQYSNAFGESSTNQNESGTYFGINAKPASKITLSGYYDVFKFPWLKYATDAPSKGNEYLAQITYSPAKRTEMYIRYSETNKEENGLSSNTEAITSLVATNKRRVRFNINYKVSNAFTFGNRLEYVQYNKEGVDQTSGFLIYQDIDYKPLSMPIAFSLRYALFDTDDYNTGIYAYENDVLYAYSVPSYYYRGSRFYLTTKYHITRGIDVWLRYAQSAFTNRQVLGSGLDEVSGKLKSEIKAQLRFTF